MKKVIHTAQSRGQADHGWLKAKHSFSFANYYDKERMGFGALRVLNDDIIAPGMGFGTHPHNDMEIITIPLEGDLEHKDSMGNGEILHSGEIQVMSAGTGIEHSEFNPNSDLDTKLLQIWVKPKSKGATPRYEQFFINNDAKDSFIQIVSPDKNDAGSWIHQDAWFYLGEFSKEHSHSINLNKENSGFYIFNIEGNAEVSGTELSARDGLGIWESSAIELNVNPGSKLLVMEIPMQ